MSRMKIGSYQFPQETTVVDLSTELVLGRVRKVVRFSAVCQRLKDREDLLYHSETLQGELEKFDRGMVPVSIQTGRCFFGRRRKFHSLIDQEHCLLVVEGELIANDRFEYSEEEYELSAGFEEQPWISTLEIGGNWTTPAGITLAAVTSIHQPVFELNGRSWLLQHTLAPGDLLVVGYPTPTVILNETINLLSKTSGHYPELEPGENQFRLVSEDTNPIKGTLTLRWRERWV